MNVRTRRSRPCRVLQVLVLVAVACTSGLAAAATSHAIQRAVDFLAATQLDRELDLRLGELRLRDHAGDWPQYFRLQGVQQLQVRDVSPFTVAFIHHALTHLVQRNRAVLGLRQRDITLARTMRQRAVGFIAGFESPPGTPDAGTFGFWPYDAYPALPEPALGLLLTLWLRGPILGGERVPLNLSVYPSLLAIPSDADVTATAYAALLDDAEVDGGPGSNVAFERFFADWRDLGTVPRRLNPPWLPAASGAFLTWLTYRDSPVPRFANDVDLVVNANVLYALGRHGRLALAGVSEATALINAVVARGVHRSAPATITDYYPDNLVFHYAVSRAYREGGVADLQPAVARLAAELEAEALHGADGAVRWDRGAPVLNTAFAVLTLLNAGRGGPLVEAAVRYLESRQDFFGGFEASPFFIARNDGGQVFEFYSRAFTTAMVVEALARSALARAARVSAQKLSDTSR